MTVSKEISNTTHQHQKRLGKKIYDHAVSMECNLLCWLKKLHHTQDFLDLHRAANEVRCRCLKINQFSEHENDLKLSYLIIIHGILSDIQHIVVGILVETGCSKSILKRLNIKEFVNTMKILKETLRVEGKIYG